MRPFGNLSHLAGSCVGHRHLCRIKAEDSIGQKARDKSLSPQSSLLRIQLEAVANSESERCPCVRFVQEGVSSKHIQDKRGKEFPFSVRQSCELVCWACCDGKSQIYVVQSRDPGKRRINKPNTRRQFALELVASILYSSFLSLPPTTTRLGSLVTNPPSPIIHPFCSSASVKDSKWSSSPPDA